MVDSAVAAFARSQGKRPVCFGATDLVCCRTLQGHTGKVRFLFVDNFEDSRVLFLTLTVVEIFLLCREQDLKSLL